MSKRKATTRFGRLAAGLLILCAGLWLAFPASLARAVPGPSQHGVPAIRTWENYFGVSILPSGRSIVVGDKGLVMSSDDQGKTWSRQQLKNGLTPFDLYSVAFTPDGSSGLIAGDSMDGASR